MLAGDFELVDSDHEPKATVDEKHIQLSQDSQDATTESGDSPVVVEKVTQDAKDEAATQKPVIADNTPAAAVDADPPASIDTPVVQPQQPLKKSGSASKSARSIAKIADPSPVPEAEQSTGLLSKTSELVSQAISSSEKVIHFIPQLTLRSVVMVWRT
jgi:hypothetical protein